jgi:hypothetical protein
MYQGKDFATVEMFIQDGELIVSKAVRKEACVRDFDLALQKLVDGETVYVLQYEPLVTKLQRTLRVALGGKR